MTTIKQLYRGILRQHDMPWCWACGRDGSYSDMPADWFSQWDIERSHVVNSPRVEDRRAIVLLCSLCHQVSHGQRIVTVSRPVWPRLERRHLLWLKFRFDREFYDREFLQRHCNGALPAAVKPPIVYLRAYVDRRGETV